MYPIVTPEQQLTAEILGLYGISSNDYFKLWPDKTYLFNKNQTGVVAYGVSHHIGFAYGDPVAPRQEIENMVDAFVGLCHNNGWTAIFYQVMPTYLDVYRKKGFRVFKASEDAIVDLEAFSLAGKEGKQFRSVINHFEREGIVAQLFHPPVPDEVIAQAQTVSDQWLQLGRRERNFVLGRFSKEYVRHTPLLAAFNRSGMMLAFVNLIPSYAKNTATIDMMRHREDAPNSTMDFLFLKLLEHNRAQGFRYFSMGPAPILDAKNEKEKIFEEKIYHKLARHLDFYFSMSGLRQYKAKFATIWEPHYLIYPHSIDLPRLLQAMTTLTELPENKQPILSPAHRHQLQSLTVELISEINRKRKSKST